MIPAIAGAQEWAAIIELTDGMDVVQVGCQEGHDTVAIARFAARVVACGQRPNIPHGAFSSAYEQWRTLTRFYGVANKTLMLMDYAAICLSTFVPEQFDVAVLDLTAFPAAEACGLISQAAGKAQTVIVIPVLMPELDREIKQVISLGRTVRAHGGLWLIETPEIEETIESKDED